MGKFNIPLPPGISTWEWDRAVNSFMEKERIRKRGLDKRKLRWVLDNKLENFGSVEEAFYYAAIFEELMETEAGKRRLSRLLGPKGFTEGSGI